MSTTPPGQGDDRLGTLRDVLRTASTLLDQMVADPLLDRLVRVFLRLPAPDRAVVVHAIEREADLLSLADAADGSLTPFRTMRPNPHARLYLRVTEQPTPYLSREEMMLATIRAVRTIHGSLSDMRADWQEAVVDALRTIEPAEQAQVAEFARDILALLARSQEPDASGHVA